VGFDTEWGHMPKYGFGVAIVQLAVANAALVCRP